VEEAIGKGTLADYFENVQVSLRAFGVSRFRVLGFRALASQLAGHGGTGGELHPLDAAWRRRIAKARSPTTSRTTR
jgi:hypothetical protein